MADKTINDFTAATTLAGGDLFEIENTGNNSRKITAANAAKALATLGLRGALVKKAADQTAANYTAGAAVAWDNVAPTYDTDSIWSSGANTRLSVPAGVSWVRLSCKLNIGNNAVNNWLAVNITKNGSTAYAGEGSNLAEPSGATFPVLPATTAVLNVVGGTDYFEVTLRSEADASIDIESDDSWFSMEILG